jgi:hypothetical protein
MLYCPGHVAVFHEGHCFLDQLFLDTSGHHFPEKGPRLTTLPLSILSIHVARLGSLFKFVFAKLQASTSAK